MVGIERGAVHDGICVHLNSWSGDRVTLIILLIIVYPISTTKHFIQMYMGY